MTTITALVFALLHTGCSQAIACTISGCELAYKECIYPGYGPCECVEWKCPTGQACDDGNPLTYRDTCNTNHTCIGTPVPFQAVFLDSMSKVTRLGSLPASNTSTTLTAARNEFEAIQLAFHVTSGNAFSVTATPPTNTQGQQLFANVYREQFVRLSYPSGPDGKAVGPSEAALWWPDRLIPSRDDMNGGDYIDFDGTRAYPVSLPSGDNSLAYIEVHVPPGAASGRYTSAVSITWNEGGQPYSSSWQLAVDVEPFSIPSTSSLPTLYRRSAGKICTAHGLTGVACDPLLLAYEQFALDHRISVDPDQWPDSAFIGRYQSYMNGTTAPQDLLHSPRLHDALPRTTGVYTDRSNHSATLAPWNSSTLRPTGSIAP